MTDDPNISDGGEIIPPENKVELAKPLIIVLVIVSVFVFALGIGLGIVYFTSPKTPIIPANQPSQLTSEPIKSKETSKLATDAAVLKTAGDLTAYQQELNRLDLLEPQLAPPTIDLNINIQ